MALYVFPRPAPAQPPPPTTGMTYAVVVGLDYNWSPNNGLKFTLSDARRFQQFLHAPAGHTVFLTDDAEAAESGDDAGGAQRATRENILQAIRRIAARSKPEDTFWFYFSGHGQFLPASESSFLIPADIKTLTAQSGISVHDLRTLLSDPTVCRARTRILVLDACESGSSRQWHEVADSGTPSDTRAIARPFAPLPGVITFAASRPDRFAWETEEAPVAGGIFTYYLCCGLAGAGLPGADHPTVTLDALQKYVVAHVDALCDRLGHPRQEPVFLTAYSDSTTRDAMPAAPDTIPVGHYDPAELAQLLPDRAVGLTALHERPPLEPGVILVVDAADPAVRTTAQTALQRALIARGVALYSGEIAPQFLAVLRDPKRTEQGLAEARRLSARLLLHVHVEPSTSASTVVSGAAIVRLSIHAEVTDVYGATKAAADADAGPTPTGDSPLLIHQTLDEQIRSAIETLTAADTELLGALPRKRL